MVGEVVGRESVISRGGFIMMPYTNRMTVAKKSLQDTQAEEHWVGRGRRTDGKGGCWKCR